MTNLHDASAGYRRLREVLLVQYPELAEDERALVDTLDGISDLDTAIAAVMASREDDLALIEAIKARTSDLTARKSRIEARADAKKAAVLSAMVECGRRKIDLPEITLSVTPVKPSVVITDETLLPDDVKEPQPAKVSRTLIKAALDEGKEVPGAYLSNGGQTLSVRRK